MVRKVIHRGWCIHRLRHTRIPIWKRMTINGRTSSEAHPIFRKKESSKSRLAIWSAAFFSVRISFRGKSRRRSGRSQPTPRLPEWGDSQLNFGENPRPSIEDVVSDCTTDEAGWKLAAPKHGRNAFRARVACSPRKLVSDT